MLAPESPGRVLRALRLTRKFSQEALALRAAISTRHLSCLETGRALPSRNMLMTLGSALDLSLRERNHLLVSAGFAPAYRETPLGAPAMSVVEQVVNRFFQLHEPHPAMLLDRGWDVLRLNGAAARLFAWLELSVDGARPINAYRVLFDAAVGLRARIVNFEDLADTLLERLAAEAQRDPVAAELHAECERLRGARARPLAPSSAGAAIVALPIHLRHRDRDLRWFTTLTTLGAPLDVGAEDLRIEGYFPLDDATDRAMREMVGAVEGR